MVDPRIQALEAIKKLLTNMGKSNDVISKATLATNIKNDLHLDSVALVYLIHRLEKTFNVDLGEIKPNDFVTIGDFVDFVLKKI